jgi:hypothetical protein
LFCTSSESGEFQRIDPAKLSSIFKDFLTSDLLGEVLSVLDQETVEGAEQASRGNVFPILKGLSQVPRFDFQAMFLSDEQKSGECSSSVP